MYVNLRGVPHKKVRINYQACSTLRLNLLWKLTGINRETGMKKEKEKGQMKHDVRPE